MNQQGASPPRVSVIVPVFDVEDHIADCIASLRAQSGVAFEVIVVDDGARDASARRAADAMADDPRFRLIRQDNRGLSAARNAGLAQATAPLIAFVDGDDRVAPDFLSAMVDALDRTGADWVACAIAFAQTDPDAPGHGALHSAIHGAADLSRHGALRRHDLTDWRDVARHFPSAWNKLYRRTLIDGLTFPEGTWYEDHEFYWQAAARTDHILHLPRPLYIQTRGRAGQITAQDDDRVAQQFDVLRRLRRIIGAGDKSHGDEAFSRIASRLLFERSTVLRNPERRASYLRDAALFLREQGISYNPDWDPDIALTLGRELEGHLPLSVVIPWNGSGDLGATLASLARLHGPGREVLVVCDSAATAAHVDLANHPEARTLVQPGRGPGPARDHGLAHARGDLVVFLRAGDTALPGALQALADRMVSQDADLGLMPHLDARGDTRAPIFGDARADGVLTPDDLLDLRPILSAALFRRLGLSDGAPAFGTAPHGHWSALLRVAHAARTIVSLDWPGVRLGPFSRQPPRARDLVRGHTALIAALPRDLKRAWPDGWKTRFLARALSDMLMRADGPILPHRERGLALTALTAKTGTVSPPFDPGTPRALRRFLHRGRPIRDGLKAPSGLLDTLVRPDITLAPDLRHALYMPLLPGDTLRLRARFDRKTRYANLGLLDRDGTDALLHISLQPDSGLIACNDFRDGAWGAVVQAPLDLQGRDDVDLCLSVAPSRVEIALNGIPTFTFGDGTAPSRFADLGAVRYADPAGGVDLASVQLDRMPVARTAPPAPRGRLVLDDRLILRGVLRHAGPALLHVTGGTDTLPPTPIVDPETGHVAAALPGRLWRGTTSLTIHLRDPKGTDLLPPLTVTKADIRARLETRLADPDLRADPEAAMLVIEHARFAGLTDALSSPARRALDTLVHAYRLDDFLPRAPRAVPRTVNGGQVLLNAALAQVSHALAADPAPDPDAVLAQIVLPRSLAQTHLLELSDAFTCDGRDPAPLFRHARRLNAPPFAPGPDIWRNSAMLPFLWDQNATPPLIDAIRSMAADHGAWYATAPLAWILRQALSDDGLAAPDRDAIASGFMAFVAGDIGAYPRRAACRALTRAAAYLVAHRDRLTPDLQTRIPDWTAREFGLSPAFWNALSEIDENGTVSPELAPFRDTCTTLTQPPTAAEADEALNLFDRIDAPDSPRIRRDLLGPGGSPPGTLPPEGTDLLRHMASPGAPPVTDPAAIRAVRQAMRDLYGNTPQAPEIDRPAPAPHDILVVVLSCRANLDTRIPAMRDGWLGHLAARGIPHIVVTGDGDGRQAGDVVHLDAPDDYEGLPQKVLAAIDWVRDNTQAGHMLKVDDDCFVNVDAFFDNPTYRTVDYHGRLLSRLTGHMDRSWHMAKSGSERGRFELDRSPEPSIYADGGTGYTLSRRAMDALHDAAHSPRGRRLIAASFMEDKMVGDLLRLRGITVADAGYYVTVRRRTHPDAIPVPIWVNGFDAGAAAPVKLVHLDTHLGQKQALSRLTSPELHPKKIWPSFLDTRLGYLSHALEMVSPPDRIDGLRAAPVAVVAVMRNEMALLPRFLDHYRRLGVRAFAIADNLSDDGTLEYLAEQPDVALFSVDTEYRLSRYGVAWQQALLSAFRVGRWSLLADADELLVWQANRAQSLPDLLEGPDFAQADAARVFMLDMYPRGPLSEADFTAADPFAQAGYCDAQPFLPGAPGKGPFSNGATWTSALRHRLLPGSRPQLFVAQKYALLRYHPFLQLSDGLHYLSGAGQIAPRELLFGHFKYNADFRRKALAEVARGQHFNNAEEYRRYLALMSESRETVFEPGLSVPWTDSPFVRARLTDA